VVGEVEHTIFILGRESKDRTRKASWRGARACSWNFSGLARSRFSVLKQRTRESEGADSSTLCCIFIS
jgi:hypothetical protein